MVRIDDCFNDVRRNSCGIGYKKIRKDRMSSSAFHADNSCNSNLESTITHTKRSLVVGMETPVAFSTIRARNHIQIDIGNRPIINMLK